VPYPPCILILPSWLEDAPALRTPVDEEVLVSGGDRSQVGLGTSGTYVEESCRRYVVGVSSDLEVDMATREFSQEEARAIGERIGIDWESGQVDLEQFRMGLAIELEHGSQDPATDVTHDDEVMTGKIALAHLNEIPDYYTRLAAMEREAEA